MYGNVNRKRKKDGSSYKDYFYYTCKHRKYVDGHNCSYKKQWGEEKVNDAVAEVIKKLVNNPNFVEEIKSKIDMSIDTTELDNELFNMRKQLKQIQGLMKMLTFEKVLEVFKDYLEKDSICEVVTTKQGYTVLYWDSRAEEWYRVTYCKTPEIMRDTFLDGYHDLLEQGYTHNHRNLTQEEKATITLLLDEIRKKCYE